MKCPQCNKEPIVKFLDSKCKSCDYGMVEKDGNVFCPRCGGTEIKEPTTAEKLLWLADSFWVHIEKPYFIRLYGKGKRIDFIFSKEEGYKKYCEYENFYEAIDAAYDWAVKEEE